MNNKSKNLPIGSTIKHKTKKSNSTSKAKKTRSVARFFDVKVRLTSEEFVRGLPYFKEKRYISRFLLDAYSEKINRAESNDKAGRIRILANNAELILPIIKELYKQGELDFFREILQRGSNG
jgi:hypothetical protein